MQPLLGMDEAELRATLPASEPAFRARQLYEALYLRRATAFDAISNLPATLKAHLTAGFSVGRLRSQARYDSADGTRRYLLGLDRGRAVEAVFMPEQSRDTLCISTQAGCPVGCRFCLTGLLGLERNLTAGEIVGQVLHLAEDNQLDAALKRINIVLMGQGEPLLNVANVLKATRLLADERTLAISVRRITVSTSGILPGIAALARADVRPKLAISLNASSDEQRCDLMPITRKYPLKDLLAACRTYPLRAWEKLTFEYVLLGGVNDSDADARRVARLLANLNCKLNLIPLNPGPGIPFQTPAPDRVSAFQALVVRSLPCYIRRPRGLDIFAACGQLKRMHSEAAPASPPPSA